MATTTFLKRGTCGDIMAVVDAGQPVIVRDLRTARFGSRRLARHLARREARALERLAGLAGIPDLIRFESDRLTRSFLPGHPMHEAQPQSRAYFRDALRLLRRVHCQRVAHNDLAKEANWICNSDSQAAIVDFQLAVCFKRRNRWFRWLAREDLRHLLKHKAHYRPDTLTASQRNLLRNPSWLSRCWRLLFKPAYHFVTRRLLGWPERTGAAERERRMPN